MAFFLWLVLSHVDWFLTLYPPFGVQISGKLVEAVVVDMDAAKARPEKGVSATVEFDIARQTRSGAINQKAVATVMLPAEVAAETVEGNRIPITYLPGEPEYAIYGVVTNHWFVGDTVTLCLIFAALAAFAFWFPRSRARLANHPCAIGAVLHIAWAIVASILRIRLESSRDESVNHRCPIGAVLPVTLAIISGIVALPCFFMTAHLLNWELGMANAKRMSPSEIKELYIQDGNYYAKYAVVMEDGRGFWRTREFNVSEIDDIRKMKVGRKFDVVYIEGNPGYNRPDWVEDIHAPGRKSWIALWATAGFGAVIVALLMIDCARGGPNSPPQLPIARAM